MKNIIPGSPGPKTKRSFGIHFLKEVLDRCGYGIGCYDLKGKLIYMNREGGEALGMKPAEITGKTVSQIFDRKIGTQIMKRIQAVVKGSEKMAYVDKIFLKEQIRYHHSIYTPIYDGKNQLQGVQIASSDVTTSKKTEKNLSEKNVFIQSVLDNLPIGLAINKVKEGEATYINSKFEEIYGWPKEVINNIEHFFQHVYPDPEYRSRIRKQIMEDIGSGDPERMQWSNVKIRTKHKGDRVVDANNIPLPDQGLMISLVQDVTDRERALELLIESESRYRVLAEAASDIIVIHDLEGRVQYANPAAISLLKMDEKESIGKPVTSFLPENEIEQVLSRQQSRRKGDQKMYQYEIKASRDDGQSYCLEVVSTPVIRNEEVIGILIIARDITERKQAGLLLEQKVAERTAELTEKNEQLEKMNRLFVGREFRIKELRERILELENELDKLSR